MTCVAKLSTFRLRRHLVVVAGFAALIGCTSEPTIDQIQTEFAALSEEAEIELGKNAHAELLEHYGRYDNDVLQGLVQRVGEQLAANSARADLIFRFVLLDSPEVNAFSLPGGYVYVTRGLFAYLNSEADLAAVLAHEIAHVVARHSVSEYLRNQPGDLEAAVGSVFLPVIEDEQLRRFFRVLGNPLLNGYGDERERLATRMGASLLVRTGYDPEAMMRIMAVLKEDGLRRLSTDPALFRGYHATAFLSMFDEQRMEALVSAAGSVEVSSTRVRSTENFLKFLDGLAFGDSLQAGIHRGERFFHKPLGFSCSLPAGWSVYNQPTRLIAFAPEHDALFQLVVREVEEPASAKAFLEASLGSDGAAGGHAINPAGLEGYSAMTRVESMFGVGDARFAVVLLEGKAFIMVAVAKDEAAYERNADLFSAIIMSVAPLAERQATLAEPLHVELREADGGLTFASLASGAPEGSISEDALRLLNQRTAVDEPHEGEFIKFIQ